MVVYIDENAAMDAEKNGIFTLKKSAQKKWERWEPMEVSKIIEEVIIGVLYGSGSVRKSDSREIDLDTELAKQAGGILLPERGRRSASGGGA